MSELTKGMDSTKSVKNSARLNRISKKRACQIDDFFYKAAHYIVDFCLKNKVEVIVCGHNKDQKQPWLRQQSALCQYSIHKILLDTDLCCSKGGYPGH